ncbi:hypothetical protein [Actinomadura sp. NEAU-AAG7]|uniref:hypothetical protein n=1 Tax=Actinomadura sp. NEAU-AAG7 TaxID=2839640 RepID=UPI001BE425A7|nr:hypothetical protein [Actinomadura sp. NEAU-AAG7]MBT2209006.1 hypothetical protein [Actinomadura sp. NEAU-AAG7]
MSVTGGGSLARTDGPRLRRLAETDPAARDVVAELLRRALRGLPRMRTSEDGGFVFTMRGDPARPAGTSVRYAAIVALGAAFLPEDDQRAALGGDSVAEVVGALVARLGDTGPGEITSLGDIALICWAAAETGHGALEPALARLAAADPPGERPVFTVDAAWVASALAAARDAGAASGAASGTEGHLERARDRLLAGLDGRPLFAHEVGGTGLVPRYRAHVGCFADQVYPVQALARIGDDRSVAAADRVAGRICAAQGAAGQWWWHYDARTGGVVEGYPVYSVHQHAMAPMALLDLADAGGDGRLAAIARGVRWLTAPAETGASLLPGGEPGEPVMTWRKVARDDPRKVVRGVRAASTRLRPGLRFRSLDRRFPPVAIDRECRPYELGWLLHTWLSPTARE